MNSAMNKNRLAEKRYRHKLKKDKKEIRLNTKNIKNKKKLEKLKKIIKNTIVNYNNQKRPQNDKRKNNMS